ncbi:MAG TPA: hypothetical protein PKE47_14985 [Verrucomicrobiota bacterium]|nr:hypothetical protein [Verrucomicrobiota bacterium]
MKRVVLLLGLVLPAAWAQEPEEAAVVAGDAYWTQRTGGSFEGLFATDVQLTSSALTHRAAHGIWEGSVGVGLNTYGLDYEPADFDFLGRPERVDEARWSGQFNGRVRALPRLTVLASAGVFDGFPDYRSLWLSTYYAQQFADLSGYVAPDPGGWTVGGGLRWEWLPGAGFLQGEFTYLNEEIAPGYENVVEGLRRGRDRLYTTAWRISEEHILHRRVRLLNEVRLTDTTDRERRFAWQGAVNVALGERWTLRPYGGYAEEDPRFEAWYVGGAVEYQLAPHWFLNAAGRYYEDTGEIENSNFSNAAPGVDTWHAGLGVRYVREGFTARLFAAPYATRYEPFGIGSAFFANLYRDRDWGLVQAAATFEF